MQIDATPNNQCRLPCRACLERPSGHFPAQKCWTMHFHGLGFNEDSHNGPRSMFHDVSSGFIRLRQTSSDFIRLTKHPTFPPQRSTAQRNSSACVVHSPPWAVASRITHLWSVTCRNLLNPSRQTRQQDQSEPGGWPFWPLLQTSGTCDSPNGNQLNQLCYSTNSGNTCRASFLTQQRKWLQITKNQEDQQYSVAAPAA